MPFSKETSIWEGDVALCMEQSSPAGGATNPGKLAQNLWEEIKERLKMILLFEFSLCRMIRWKKLLCQFQQMSDNNTDNNGGG